MYLCFSKIGLLLPLFFHRFFLTVSDGEVRAHSSLHPSGPQRGVREWEQFVQDASNMGALPDGNFKTIQHIKCHMAVHIKVLLLLLLLLLSRFSRVQLCATPKTAAHQAPRSLGFSRQEHWSGLPFPSPMHESEK